MAEVRGDRIYQVPLYRLLAWDPTDIARGLALVYVQSEGPMPGTVRAQSLTAALQVFGFGVPEIQERSKFDPSISDPKALVNCNRSLLRSWQQRLLLYQGRFV